MPIAALVFRKYSESFLVARAPIAQVRFEDDHGGSNRPAQFGHVGEADMDVEVSFLEFVLGGVYDLPSDAGVLLSAQTLPRRACCR